MVNGSGKLLVYFDSEAHLVRRLGAAVVACWSDIPKAVQDKLIAKATDVVDEDESDRVDEQIKRFIADHAGSL